MTNEARITTSIFREYDIRGIFESELNEQTYENWKHS